MPEALIDTSLDDQAEGGLDLGLALERLRDAELVVRLAAGLRAVVDLDAVARLAGALRLVVPPERAVEALRVEPELPPALLLVDEPVSLSVHLPDMTRWAASATASAISVPSREALFIIEEAALLALSAASMPASRIARRALGLAAIAAAAAVRPAASISRLIAALAILSIVVLFVVLLLALPPLLEALAMMPSVYG